MPSRSAAQKRLMAAVAHGWEPDRIEGPSKQVAQEFHAADRKLGRIGRGKSDVNHSYPPR